MVKKCFQCFLIIFIPISLFAQHDQQNTSDSISKATTIKEIRISAKYINDSLQNAPAAIGILSKGDLTRNNHSDISTAMNTIPGVLMQSSNFTTNRISIRGIGARTPYGTNKIRAFYGSIPLTSGDSETTIDDIDVENIQKAEIIKGPLSSVYGAGLGGAILILPDLSSGEKAGFSVVHGSFGLLKNAFHYNLAKNASSANISYHHLETEGWRQNSAYKRDGITLSGELFRTSRSSLTYLNNYTALKAFIPSSINKKTFDENPKAAAPTWLASKGYKEYNGVLSGMGYDFEVNKNLKNATSVFVNYKDNYETRPFDILHQYTFASGGRTQFSGNLKSVNFICGMEYFADNYHARTLENLYKQNDGQGSLEGDLLAAERQKRNFYNAFVQIRMPLLKKFELQGGLNFNKTFFSLHNLYPSQNTSREKYSYDAIWSPQLSILFKPGNLKTIYLSASRGYSLPSVNETLTATGNINAAIKPESGYNFELGGKFYFLEKTLYTEIALYRMQIMDLLIAQRVADDQYVGVNAGETLHLGIEFSLSHLWQINADWSLNSYVAASLGNYEFREFTDRGNDFSGKKLTGVPASKANAGIALNAAGCYLSADYLFVDKIPLNDSNTTYADAYAIINLKCGYKFKIFQKLTSNTGFGINNITNEHYASMILPNAVAVGNNSPRYYYPGLPVNYYATIAVYYSF